MKQHKCIFYSTILLEHDLPVTIRHKFDQWCPNFQQFNDLAAENINVAMDWPAIFTKVFLPYSSN